MNTAPEITDGKIELPPTSGLRFLLAEQPHRVFFASLILLVVRDCIFGPRMQNSECGCFFPRDQVTSVLLALAGVYGLASQMSTIPAMNIVCAGILAQALFTVFVAGMGLTSMRLHHNFLLGIV
jgi:hypothetical protein